MTVPTGDENDDSSM